MDIRDFEGIRKYKIIIPTCYIISWLWMMFGPVMYFSTYQKFCAFFLLYLDIKVIIFFTIMIIITVKTTKIFKRAQLSQAKDKGTENNLKISQQIFYGFIIPNFREEIEMLIETLNVLAEHSRAKDQYLIFLAMEAHEEGSEKKAQKLITKFSQKFRLIDYTRHQVRQNEQKGKASNVSWCAEHLQPIFSKNLIDSENVFLTILDADSWAPNLYFDILEEQIVKNYEKRHSIIFQPPQIFTRNHLDVPITTRVYDLMHAFSHCTNLYSIFDFTFALSNYTLSYKLIKSIGFWDTCSDAIGQDFHTCQKAYWKTDGQVSTIPIYVPFNQVNIMTGNGYLQDALARFWQAERHAQGCSDMAWSMKMLLSKKFKIMNFIVFYQIFENTILPTIMPWIFLSLMLQKNILFREVHMPEESLPPVVMKILFNVLSVVSTLGYFLFEIFKRRANRIIYKKQNQSIFRIIQYPIIFSVNFFAIAVPTFVIAGFMSVLGNREYIVAEKKNTIKSNS